MYCCGPYLLHHKYQCNISKTLSQGGIIPLTTVHLVSEWGGHHFATVDSPAG